MKYTDPSGHYYCEGSSDCEFNKYHLYTADQLTELATETLKYLIPEKFGIEMVDGTMNWSLENLSTTYDALKTIDDKLNGNLKSMVGRTTFTMAFQGKCTDEDGSMRDCYHGESSSTGVTYYSSYSSVKLPIINILHETGHLLNFVPATNNVFSDPLKAKLEWVGDDGYVRRDILGDMFFEPVQSRPMKEPNNPWEYWADAFGNYMAGNIDLSDPLGSDMANYVSGALS